MPAAPPRSSGGYGTVPKEGLDLDFIRRQFPPLGNGWAFFENAGGSYVPQSVIDRVRSYMAEVHPLV